MNNLSTFVQLVPNLEKIPKNSLWVEVAVVVVVVDDDDDDDSLALVGANIAVLDNVVESIVVSVVEVASGYNDDDDSDDGSVASSNGVQLKIVVSISSSSASNLPQKSFWLPLLPFGDMDENEQQLAKPLPSSNRGGSNTWILAVFYVIFLLLASTFPKQFQSVEKKMKNQIVS